MNFDLTAEQKMLADTVASFVKQKSPVERFRKLRKAGQAWDPAVWAEMGELGWLGLPFPEEMGGFGGGPVEVMLVLERFGGGLVPEPFLASVVLAGAAVREAASATQAERVLAPMIAGSGMLALAWAEPAGRYDVTPGNTKATRSGGAWTLDGEKVFVLAGQIAEQLVVSARTPDGPGLFVVPRDAAGVEIRAVRTIDAHGAAHVRLSGVKVDDADRLGDPGPRVVAALGRALDEGAAGACAEGLGVCAAMLKLTKDHLRTREQFGQPIGAFQALQHRAVEMFVESELVRSAATLAAVEAGNTDPAVRTRAVSLAKAKLTTGGRFVAQQAIQLHGGIGITDEHDIGLYFKRMHVLERLCGDEEFHVARLAEMLPAA